MCKRVIGCGSTSDWLRSGAIFFQILMNANTIKEAAVMNV